MIKAIEMKKSKIIINIVPNENNFEFEIIFSIKGILESLSFIFFAVLNIFKVNTKVKIVANKIEKKLIYEIRL